MVIGKSIVKRKITMPKNMFPASKSIKIDFNNVISFLKIKKRVVEKTGKINPKT